LESGLYLLIFVCLWRLKDKLELEGNELADYVLNQQTAIDEIAAGDDENASQMEIILAELDAGIFALVEDLDCDVSEVASKLDDALHNSLWKRRIAVKELAEQTTQTAMLRGRSTHIWSRTTTRQRRGFFSASIGTESGLEIVAQASELRELLESSTEAIKSGSPDKLVSGCCELAKRLFTIHHFRPNMPNDWNEETWTLILEAWLTGATLYRVTNAVGIAFVQEALVFRLVWAIEAVRIVLLSLDGIESDSQDDDDRTFVAICMTYGVPSVAAARILESGMESRLLAVRLAKELNLTFTTHDEMVLWLLQIDNTEPIEFSETEREAWRSFARRNIHSFEQWVRRNDTYKFAVGEGIEIDPGTSLRLLPNNEGTADLYTPEFVWVGRTDSQPTLGGALIGVAVSSNEIEVHTFGTPELPEWLKEHRAAREDGR